MRLAFAFAALFLAAALPGTGRAQAPVPDYAVVSIIGDRLSIADRNTDVRRQGHEGYAFPVGSSAIDGAALHSVKDAMARLFPELKVSLVLVREPAVFEAEEEVLVVTKDTQPLVDALQPVLGKIKARRLILISKARGAADAEFENKMIQRPGTLEGLGFYLDPGKLKYDLKAGRATAGYLGIFTYFRVSIVDQDSHRVLDEEHVAVVETMIGMDSWENLTAEQKVDSVKAFVNDRIQEIVPRLIERSR